MSSTPVVIQRGSRQIARSIVVNAPASTLFEILVHPDRHREIDGSGTVGASSTGNGRMVQGETFTMSMKMFGIPYRITSTVTEVVADRVVEWQHPGGHRWRYEFEPLGPESTRVTEIWDYRDAKAAKAYEILGVPKRNTAGIESTLTRMAEQFGS
jgi:uncharacterized protein YndB with AHSA1/START domain